MPISVGQCWSGAWLTDPDLSVVDDDQTPLQRNGRSLGTKKSLERAINRLNRLIFDPQDDNPDLAFLSEVVDLAKVEVEGDDDAPLAFRERDDSFISEVG